MDVTVSVGGERRLPFQITFEHGDDERQYILYSSELPGYIDIPRIWEGKGRGIKLFSRWRKVPMKSTGVFNDFGTLVLLE
jgi:hypothetical protein